MDEWMLGGRHDTGQQLGLLRDGKRTPLLVRVPAADVRSCCSSRSTNQVQSQVVPAQTAAVPNMSMVWRSTHPPLIGTNTSCIPPVTGSCMWAAIPHTGRLQPGVLRPNATRYDTIIRS
eukprot:GHVU01141393.1.p1 GENE.GHVU01141393.1~~GHVU01141393.1.p1  ORF type:complete len:119 (+),score=8.61 GHVU01141393.1:148-504(+)